MQFKTLALAAAGAGAAAAADATPKYFSLISIHSGSAVQNQGFQASQNGIFVGKKDQGAECDKETNFATFYIDNGDLYLYRQSATPQQLFVDRSGQGAGLIGYTTGAQPIPSKGERSPWAVSNSHLSFDGSEGFQACADGNGEYSIWLSGGTPPQYKQEDCIGIAAHVQETTEPISCLYSQQGQ